jgi:hypothetical protein
MQEGTPTCSTYSGVARFLDSWGEQYNGCAWQKLRIKYVYIYIVIYRILYVPVI